MTRKEIETEVLKLSEGVVERVTDLVLSFVHFQMVVLERPTTYSVMFKAPQETERFLRKVNYQTIKRALGQLISRGLIKKSGRNLVLTKMGMDRLIDLFPGVGETGPREKGEVYLIFYDIANSSKGTRDNLRRFLKNSGAVAIQESVFLSTWNLREKLLTLLEGPEIAGQILITKLGKDSIIGKETVVDFVSRVYKLDELVARYKDFLTKFSEIKGGEISPLALDFAFNSIYRHDPKLPAEFLPKDWAGYQALSFYRKYRKS